MTLACPACDSRYDVTGHTGEKFRCRCGVLLTLAAPPPTEDSSLDRAAAAPARAEGASRLTCPRCAQPLRQRAVADLTIDECRTCHGVFLDTTAVDRLLLERNQGRANALLTALPRATVKPLPDAGEKMYLPCPVCHAMMNRRLFAAGTGVIVDVCRGHGTFFDAGELPQVIDHIVRGGQIRAHREPRPQPARPPRESVPPPAALAPLPPAPAPLPIARVVHGSPHTAASALVELLADLFG